TATATAARSTASPTATAIATATATAPVATEATMLNKIIGVSLDKALDPDIVWTKTTTGYSASCDAENKPVVITIDELPPDARNRSTSGVIAL
ncbi:MAG: hypothetical protein NTW47_18725, partial [Proteobacteria bacterium]|nr:hypothetical protein [Pseudomonadota bacterium]